MRWSSDCAFVEKHLPPKTPLSCTPFLPSYSVSEVFSRGDLGRLQCRRGFEVEPQTNFEKAARMQNLWVVVFFMAGRPHRKSCRNVEQFVAEFHPRVCCLWAPLSPPQASGCKSVLGFLKKMAPPQVTSSRVAPHSPQILGVSFVLLSEPEEADQVQQNSDSTWGPLHGSSMLQSAQCKPDVRISDRTTLHQKQSHRLPCSSSPLCRLSLPRRSSAATGWLHCDLGSVSSNDRAPASDQLWNNC